MPCLRSIAEVDVGGHLQSQSFIDILWPRKPQVHDKDTARFQRF